MKKFLFKYILRAWLLALPLCFIPSTIIATCNQYNMDCLLNCSIAQIILYVILFGYLATTIYCNINYDENGNKTSK